MKKTLKRILASIMVAVMVLTAVPLSGFVGLELPNIFDIFASAESYSGKCGDNLTWSFNESTGELIISGTGDISSNPWSSYRLSIKKLTISDGVTSIGDNAFRSYHKLENITIPNSVISIGNYAFYDCDSLANLIIGDKVTQIGNGAFKNCHSLISVVIPDSVTVIGDSAFYDCDSLIKVKIGDNVTTINDNAFYACTNLSSVKIGSSVKSIGYRAFRDCESLARIIIPNSVTSVGDYAFAGCESLSSVTISDSITSIGNYVFSWCNSLTSIAIPNGVTSIGEDAFNWCYSLTSITIPDSVTSIGESAFNNCTSLTSITIPNSVTSIGDNAFFSCSGLTSIMIPNGISSIGKKTFYQCQGLKKIVIPDSVTTIGIGAFWATDLTDVYFLGEEEEWNEINIFTDNDPLLEATIHFSGDGICEHSYSTTVITAATCSLVGQTTYTCSKCQDSFTITIPTLPHTEVVIEGKDATCTSTGLSDGKKCSVCGEVTVEQTVTPKTSHTEVVIEGKDASCTTAGLSDGKKCLVCGEIVVSQETIPAGHKEADPVKENEIAPTCKKAGSYDSVVYCSACKEELSRKKITVPVADHIPGEWEIVSESTDIVNGLKIKKCSSCGEILEEEEIPLLDISNFDFELYYDEKLQKTCAVLNGYFYRDYYTEKVEIPSTYKGYPVTFIGDNALSGCGATEILIPNTVKYIGNSAFAHCPNIKRIDIPNSVEVIGDQAFYFCTYLGNITIPNSVTSIGSQAFYWCFRLGSVTIPDSVNNIGASAFYSCRGLYSVKIGDGVTTINSGTFAECYDLKYVTLGNNVTTIGSSAFSKCKELESIKIPNSVTTIGSYAFNSCTSLKNIIIPYGVTSIGEGAFNGCINFESAEIPDSVTAIGNFVFNGCNSLKSVNLPDGLTTIPYGAFRYCANLVDITIPSSVTEIYGHTNHRYADHYDAFAGCDNLSDIYFEGSEQEWDAIKISGNKCLKEANIHFAKPDVPSADEESIRFGESLFSLNEIIYGIPGYVWETVLVYNSKDYDIDSLKVTSNNSEVVQVLSVEKNSEDGNQKTAVVRLNFTGRGHSIITIESPTKTEYFDVVSRWKYSENEIDYSIGELVDNNKIISIEDSKIWYREVKYNGAVYQIPSYSDCFDKLDEYIGKRVAVGIADNEIVSIIPIDEIQPIIEASCVFKDSNSSVMTIDYNSKKLWGKYNEDEIPIHINVSNYGVSGNAPQKVIELLKTEGHFDVTITEVVVISNTAMITNNGKTSYVYKLSNPILLKYGQTKEIVSTEYKLDTSPQYRPADDISSISYYLHCSADYNWLNKSNTSTVNFSPILISNVNYKKPPSESGSDDSGSDGDISESAEVAADYLDSYDASVVSIGTSQTLNEILSKDQQKQIENAILTACAMATIPKKDLKDAIGDKLGEEVLGDLYSKLNPTESKSTSLQFVIKTAEYGKVIIQFDVSFTEIANSMIVGDIKYTILGDDSKLSDAVRSKIHIYQNSGSCGQIYATNIGDFVSYSQDTALSILKNQYNSAWGQDADKAADLIFSDAVKEVLKHTKKSVSGITWEMITNPTLKAYVNCPVDVYVYDAKNNLVGAVINNEIVFVSDDNIEISVEGESKIITMRNGDYEILYDSKADGTMSVVIEEYANGTGLISRHVYEDIPLAIGTSYTQNLDNDIATEADYDLTSNANETYEATRVESGFHIHNPIDSGEVYEQATCICEGKICHLCEICSEWYFEMVGNTGHVDDDHNGYCDECDLDVELRVNSVLIDDISLNYKDSATITPNINVDLGVDYTVSYSSSNTGVVSVGENGRLTTNDKGSATITVTVTDEYGNVVTDTCEVNVSYKWWQWIIVIVLFGWIWY